MRRDVIRAAPGRAATVLAFGLAATAACSDELTEPPVEAAPAAADSFATTGGDRDVLVALYEATDGPNWDYNWNWLTDAPLDEWYGVGTDASGRVQALELTYNGLTGEIPPELGKLANLEWLRLGGDGLTGEILPELGGLANLRRLDLFDNDLTGEIPPELGKLANLDSLYLENNGLTGEIPPELGKLANLRRLYLEDDGLTGEIPPELGKLANLESLGLSGNYLTGEIPPELGKLANLELLGLFETALTGEIPPELGKLASLEGLILGRNGLTGKIPPELSKLANLEYLILGGNSLTGEIPPELGKLANLWGLALVEEDGLTGEIPPELGKLANLEELDLYNNGLTGVIPPAFSDLPNLWSFKWAGNAGLCAPGTRQFISFAEGLDRQEGPFCHEADAAVLRSVYHSTRGSAWASSGSWLQPGPLADWYGVETDSVSGRVSGLDLSRNGLSGELLGNLASLDLLRELWLDGNGQLSGRLRSGMTDLPLRILSYDGTNLCTPANPAFRMWLRSISSHSGTGTECPPLMDRDVLEILFESTGGRSWGYHDNWLTDAPLEEWAGVDTDASGHVEGLYLGGNGLRGELPSELGDLANLKWLSLWSNGLTGVIPSELGDLVNLEQLSLRDNGLTGVIPPELGKLANLERLWLYNNGLTGVIPPELGDLASLEWLYLENNGLTGEIPPKLGDLASLERLYLGNNPDLFGALPLTNLIKLKELNVGGTEICVPDDSATRLRLRSMWKQYVPVCKAHAETATATAYIVQAVQSADFPVPLVAGQLGLLRVFVTAPAAGGASIPSGLATFYQRDGSTHSVRVSPGDGAIPAEAEIAESGLSLSANAEVPGDVLRPGVEMVVVLDPEGALDPALGVPRRIPATGRTALDVYDMPAFDVTVVPFLLDTTWWQPQPDSSILDLTNGMTAEDSLFEETRKLLPVGPMSVTVHEPVWSSTRSASDLLDQTEAIRVMEGGAGYYMGTSTGSSGEAYYRPGKAMHSTPDGDDIAHAFGHNMHLWHAPFCGVTGVDSGYPHAEGVAGAWGWDRRSGRLVPPTVIDIMGYCSSFFTRRVAISDYHFANALRWRLRDEAGVGAYYAGPPTQALLLWGGVGTDGAPFLNPAFVFDGRPSLLDGAGAWRIAGEAGDGRVLFSQRFEMAETADSDGRSSFALALAADSNWADALSRIVLTGPDGSVAMNAGVGPATALLRDPATGRVRGILRNWRGPAAGAQPDAGRALPERGLDLQVSSGIPRPDAWHR